MYTCSRSAKVLFAVYVTFFFKRPLFAFYTRLLCMSYIFIPLYIIINVCAHKYNYWAFGVCVWVSLNLKIFIRDCKKKCLDTNRYLSVIRMVFEHCVVISYK